MYKPVDFADLLPQMLAQVVKDRADLSERYREAMTELAGAEESLRHHLRRENMTGNIRGGLLLQALLPKLKADVDMARRRIHKLQAEAEALRLYLL